MRSAREGLHLTQAELARRVGISRAAIAELEADELVVMAATMVRMAERYRRWLRDRFAELRELLVLRRAGHTKERPKKR